MSLGGFLDAVNSGFPYGTFPEPSLNLPLLDAVNSGFPYMVGDPTADEAGAQAAVEAAAPAGIQPGPATGLPPRGGAHGLPLAPLALPASPQLPRQGVLSAMLSPAEPSAAGGAGFGAGGCLPGLPFDRAFSAVARPAGAQVSPGEAPSYTLTV